MIQNENLLLWYPFNNDVIDSSLNGHDGTATDLTPATDRFNESNKAFSFNGSTSNILVGNLGITDETSITYCAWVKLSQDWDADGDITNYVGVLADRRVSTSVLNSTSAIPVNTWTHIIYSFYYDDVDDTSTHRIYINGELDASFATETKYEFSPATIYIGSQFEGYLDDIRIYYGGLGDLEAALIYHGVYGSDKHIGENIQFRCIVENDSNLYYPSLISASTNVSYPWSASTASIVVVTNPDLGTTSYMSPIREGDPIRIQVAIRTNIYDQDVVWKDIFEGRIYSLSNDFNSANNTTILARGHEEELLYTVISSAESYSSTSSGDIIYDLIDTYCTNITGYDYLNMEDSSIIGAYNVEAYSKYIGDVVRELEALEEYKFKFGVKTVYTTNGLLSAVHPVWNFTETVANTGASVIEGSRQFISANFTSTSINKYNKVRVVGNGVSAIASTGDADRFKQIVDTTISSATTCTELAAAYIANWSDSVVSGQATILGNSTAKPGMLARCYIPSCVLNGEFIDDDYTIVRVSHSISGSGWLTTLELGKIRLTTSEILAHMNNTTRLLTSSII